MTIKIKNYNSNDKLKKHQKFLEDILNMEPYCDGLAAKLKIMNYMDNNYPELCNTVATNFLIDSLACLLDHVALEHDAKELEEKTNKFNLQIGSEVSLLKDGFSTDGVVKQIDGYNIVIEYGIGGFTSTITGDIDELRAWYGLEPKKNEFYEMLDEQLNHDRKCSQCGDKIWFCYGDGHVWDRCFNCPDKPHECSLSPAGYIGNYPEPNQPLPENIEIKNYADYPYLKHEKAYRKKY